LPAKIVYSLGESLDLAGIAVSGTYSDGSSGPLSVNAGMCSGFSSADYASSRVVTLEVDGRSATFTVRVIGDLVGTWVDGTTPKFILNADLSGQTDWCRGGSWTVQGDTLALTYTETHDSVTGNWATTTDDPAVFKWDVIVLDGKLRVSLPFFRIGEGSSLVGSWEQIAWHLGCAKVRLAVDGSGHATYSVIPVVSFDKITGEGTWNESAMYTALTCDVGFPLPDCAAHTTTTISISNSTNETIGPNGLHPITFFSANKMDIDAAAWTRSE
jgi:hypothetical protein